VPGHLFSILHPGLKSTRCGAGWANTAHAPTTERNSASPRIDSYFVALWDRARSFALLASLGRGTVRADQTHRRRAKRTQFQPQRALRALTEQTHGSASSSRARLGSDPRRRSERIVIPFKDTRPHEKGVIFSYFERTRFRVQGRLGDWCVKLENESGPNLDSTPRRTRPCRPRFREEHPEQTAL
jgi:hypothetical protein